MTEVDWSVFSRAFQVQEALGVGERQLQRLVDDGVLATRLHPITGNRIFSAAQVKRLVEFRASRPTPEMRRRARQRALWALKRRYDRKFHELYAAELAKETKDKASPAATEDASTNPVTAHQRSAR